MTTELTNAAQQALEEAHMLILPIPAPEVSTLELAKVVSDRATKIATLLTAALAQQAQEPVAWLFACRKRPDLKELSFEPHRPDLTVRGFKSRPLVFGDATSPAPQPAPVDERAEFEAWARPNGYDMRRNDVLGHYSSIDTLRAWTGWQARAALQSPAPQTKGQP